MMRTLLAGALLALVAASAPASGYEQGKVCIEPGLRVTPDQARAKGYFEYHGRWFPEKMRKTLAKWEKKDAKHAHWLRARRYTTKHYRVITNVPRFICEFEIDPFLDDLYRAYTAVFKERFGVKSKAANKKLIHIHYGYEDYAEMNREGSQPQPRATPAFIVGGSTLVTYFDDAEPEQFYSSVFHEGAHQFVHANLPGAQFPLWIEEALATYFEGCSYSRSNRKVRVSFLPPVRLVLAQRLLREKRSNGEPKWGLYEVLNARDEEFSALHYALSWSFTYFMTHAESGRRRKTFTKFLHEMNRAGLKFTPQEIFARVCKEDPYRLEPEWRAFVAGLEAPEVPKSPIVTAVLRNRAGLDLKKGDRIRSFDFHPITGVGQFARLWKTRPGDREIRLVVVRHTPVQGVREFEAKLLTIVIPAGDSVGLEANASISRETGLEE